MKRMKNVGLVLCGTALGLALSAPAAQAVESLKAVLSTNRIFVDGQEVQIEAYTIHDNNFMQLRDVGKAIGFNVLLGRRNQNRADRDRQALHRRSPGKRRSC